MDEKHGFQSEDLVEATSAMPGCECPICKNVRPGTGTVRPAPPIPAAAPILMRDINDRHIVDPQLTDYEFSDDGEVVIVLRSRQVKPQATKLITFSTPHELNVLIRSLHSVLSEASSAKGV